MNNKFLVELVVPALELNYDVFIPVNLKIGNVIELCSKVIADFSGGYFNISDMNVLYNGKTGELYGSNILVRNTDIRNGTRLILM